MDYSVKNTNKEQRRDLVKKALTISISGADVPTKETIELAKKYRWLNRIRRFTKTSYRKI